MPVGVQRGQQPHGPAGKAPVRNFTKVEHGSVAVARVLEQAVVQRIHRCAVTFKLLQKDAMVQAQRASDARTGIVALRCALNILDVRRAQPALQSMVGCSMARGWRQAIQKNLGGVASCTHLRELLFNLATAAFQSVPAVFSSANEDEPPRHLGQCTGWDFHGNGVKEYFPQFYRRSPDGLAVPEDRAATQSQAVDAHTGR